MRRSFILHVTFLPLLVILVAGHPSLRASNSKLRRALSEYRVSNSYIVILNEARVNDTETTARELFDDTNNATFEFFDSVFKGFSVSGVDEEAIKPVLDNDIVVSVEEVRVKMEERFVFSSRTISLSLFLVYRIKLQKQRPTRLILRGALTE